MHTAIATSATRPVLDVPATADVGMHCGTCLDTLTPSGQCVNVGACVDADKLATRRAPGETLKARRAPLAFTIGGRVD